MIPDNPPLESLPTNENVELDELSITNEETRENRPPSPTCSSTDEYPDSDPELPATQLSDESSDESDLRYEQPPLDWNDMDPNQRLIWLREHQLPNQKPSKLILTDNQDLTRRQINNLRKIKRPKHFHVQSPKDQPDLQQTETYSHTTTPIQISQPTLPSPEKRNYQEQQDDPNEAKKQKSEDVSDEFFTNKDPPSKSPSPIIDGTTTLDPSQTEDDPQEQLKTDKRKQPDQQRSNEDSQEAKKQRLPHDPDTSTITELTSTPTDTIKIVDASTPTDPLLLDNLMIPTTQQIVPQPYITEITTNEAILNYPNQEQTVMRTHGFKHHSLPTTEHVTEPSPLELEIPTLAQTQATPIPKPDNWNQMSARAKANWFHKHKRGR